MMRTQAERYGRGSILGIALLGFLVLGARPASSAQWNEAFPGSEGFGSKSIGGRGGVVLIVDTLHDQVAHPPEGTLRWALEEPYPRIVVFRVAGTIELAGKLHIDEPYVTVAGQTAPGGGITLKDYPIKIRTHNVILQGIRSRLGARFLNNSDSFNIDTEEAHDIMVDHCSFSWSTDEVAGVSNLSNKITFQNNIFSEGLYCSIHPDGCHSRGLLVRDGARQVTVQRNYFAHNNFRNPKLYGDPSRLGGTTATFDMYNNVVYNWGQWAAAGAGRSRVNIEANYFRLGPSTWGYPDNQEIISTDETEGYLLWADANVGPSCPDGCADDWDEMVDSTAEEYESRRRHRTPPSTKISAEDARVEVMAEAGASYRLDDNGNRVSRRDAVDLRVVNDFWNGTGGLIDDPAEVGGWPTLAAGIPVVDTDLDGMPNAWENAHGLNPYAKADAQWNLDGDLYTNVEEYIFETDPTVAEAEANPRRARSRKRAARAGKGRRDAPEGRRHRDRASVRPRG